MGVLNATISLAMASAPIVGCYVNLFFHWQGNFVALLALGALCLILAIIFLPKSVNIPNYNVSISLKSYLPIFRSSKALYYIGSISFCLVGYWVFIGIAPILYMGDLGVNLKNFAIYQGSICFAFSLLNLCSGYFYNKFTPKVCCYFSLAILALFIPHFILLIIIDIKNPLVITLTMIIYFMAFTAPINLLYPLMLESVENSKGKLSAVMGSSKLILMSIGLQIASYFYQHNFSSIGVCIIVSTVISLTLIVILLRIENIFQND